MIDDSAAQWLRCLFHMGVLVRDLVIEYLPEADMRLVYDRKQVKTAVQVLLLIKCKKNQNNL